jgi:F-type H+-transporting ATPase subunit b
MKSRVAILLTAAALWPSLAYAAENAEPQASWLSLIFYAINFALFVWLVRHYGGPRITGFFRDRAKTIRETIGRAEKAFQEAQELANVAAERIARLEAEKTAIASDLADETVYEVGRIYDIAQETVARIKRDTDLTAAALRENAQRRLRETMAAAAGRIAYQTLERNFRPEDQSRLLDGFIDRLGEEARR